MAIHLSRRLETICSLVTRGNIAVDVGTDHAHVPIRLLQDDICPKVYGYDVADGPLEIARTNVELAGLEDRCIIRKSDGLQAYKKAEADTLIISGMGGILMRSLLERDEDKAKDFGELILSPHTEAWQVREYLYTEGFGITDERDVEEDGKYYPVIRAVYGADTIRPDWEKLEEVITHVPKEELQRAGTSRESVLHIEKDKNFRIFAETTYGPVLLKRAFLGEEELLLKYIRQKLKKELSVIQKLEEKMDESKAAKTRLSEMEGRIGMLQMILFLAHILERERS